MSESLTEFLLARIAEDEAAANNWLRFEVRDGIPGNYAIKERVMAECEAKRRIVELHGGAYDGECQSPAHLDGPCATLRILALPYADHDDYRPEWRP